MGSLWGPMGSHGVPGRSGSRRGRGRRGRSARRKVGRSARSGGAVGRRGRSARSVGPEGRRRRVGFLRPGLEPQPKRIIILIHWPTISINLQMRIVYEINILLIYLSWVSLSTHLLLSRVDFQLVGQTFQYD